MNTDVDEYKNAFNINIDSNVTIHKRRPAPVINRFPERDTLGVSKQNKNLIPGYSKYNEAVRFGQKAYLLGSSMVKAIKRNLFNSCLKKCKTRLRPFLGATITQMETCIQPIIQDHSFDVVILHVGFNDISNKNMSANDIAEGIRRHIGM